MNNFLLSDSKAHGLSHFPTSFPASTDPLSETLTSSTLHSHPTFTMCNEHYKTFSECNHREVIQTWSAWIDTRIWRGDQTETLVEGLCHQCAIYEEAKAKILAAREVARAEGKVDNDLRPSWEQNRAPGSFKLRKSRRRNWWVSRSFLRNEVNIWLNFSSSRACGYINLPQPGIHIHNFNFHIRLNFHFISTTAWTVKKTDVG